MSELRARTLTWAEADPADRWEWLASVTEFLVGRYDVRALAATRWADDAEGAADLAVLLGILMRRQSS